MGRIGNHVEFVGQPELVEQFMEPRVGFLEAVLPAHRHADRRATADLFQVGSRYSFFAFCFGPPPPPALGVWADKAAASASVSAKVRVIFME